MPTTKKIVAYWRDSLKDAELASLELTEGNHIRVPFPTLKQGQLDEKETAVLFASIKKQNEEDDISTMPVVVVPIVASKGSRGRRRNKILCPLLISAQLDIDGRLRPEDGIQRPWMPRPLLEPTSSDLVLGNVDSLDNFWINNQEPIEDSPEFWKDALDLGWQMLTHITNGEWKNILKEAGYTLGRQAAIINASNLWGMSSNILTVYEYILAEKKTPALFQEIVRLQPKSPQPPLPHDKWLAPAKLHVGSFNNQFPLSPSQREALCHLLSLSVNTVLAVSGPPGTGKTTLLHSVIASLWVKAALLQESPPIMVASSTNNQAVTNVIDSLSGSGDIERWLPMSGFGLYLVNSQDKQAEANKRGILTANKYDNGFPKEAQTATFVGKAHAQYLDACSRYFERPIETVDEGVTAVHALLSDLGNTLANILDMAFKLIKYSETFKSIESQVESFQSYETIGQQQIVAAETELEQSQTLHTTFLQLLQDEPATYSLLGFVPGIKRKQEVSYQLFLSKFMPNMEVSPNSDAILLAISAQIKSAKKRIEVAQSAVAQAKKQLEDAKEFIITYTAIKQKWESWCAEFAPHINWEQLFLFENENNSTNKANLLNWLDTTLRYQLFILATHYWEGRWLQEVGKDRITAPDFKESRNQPTQEKKWRRYAMLTPCFVTTMHTGPAFFDYYDGKPNPLLDYIDLLIVDEAGQVSPEVSGAMFALAKQALVVGDVKQIEPVWSILKQVDIGNLTRCKLIRNEADFDRLETRGITASSGSVMQMSQQASPYQIPDQNGIAYERGMFLAEHRRCVPEIIGYCNELAYNGRLRFTSKQH